MVRNDALGPDPLVDEHRQQEAQDQRAGEIEDAEDDDVLDRDQEAVVGEEARVLLRCRPSRAPAAGASW